jgi:benzoyl-CoA reductase/2-hydroxyglutaryl-CoA dehydratase subunit BcrC/BadD/HgdB
MQNENLNNSLSHSEKFEEEVKKIRFNKMKELRNKLKKITGEKITKIFLRKKILKNFTIQN